MLTSCIQAYNNFVPTQAYMAFASHAGCPPTYAYGNSTETIFQCLVSKPSLVLQEASFLVSSSGFPGFLAFSLVTDGVFLAERPTQQLLRRKLNGERALIGNNAEEGEYPLHRKYFFSTLLTVQPGPSFTPQNIVTEDVLKAWLHIMVPLFTNNDIAKVLMIYPISNTTVDPNAPKFATLGNAGPTALNESQVNTGQQERADNIFAEAFIVCPSYWMAEAYSDNKASYKYQYSVPVATHGTDVAAYFGPLNVPDLQPSFQNAMISMIGAFVIHGDPSIPARLANAGFNGTTSDPKPAFEWPPYTLYHPY